MMFSDCGPLLKGAAIAMALGGRFGRHGGPRVWMWPGGGRGDWPGERRARRGDVKYTILEVLAERPRHGYDVIREIEVRSGYRPSAGSIYPTLQMLEDEGCVTSATVDGKRVYTITDAGRALLAQRPSEAGDDEDVPHSARHQLRDAALRLGAAVWQSAREGDPELMERVGGILDRARREIYTLLGGEAPKATP